ncbi:Arsenical resistance operon trans-acting repressor ArsD [Mesobacillus persicus]|uniref:Arsenical resistance operon trans-acting repressor ArsD n=1 Tax=Mesobacillus persicus TaxID=930146 RepID=A0A1H8DVX4_9BACI|nr:arsenite efflux transporter metallochaperone ArsD [Mesobacillus persicus]SEN10678.1 Arsenical resistance operon trans-acting repressor ArsD [Mesobacillus persicus]
MKRLEVFDPALCCPTGVCGPSVDPELIRIASALFLLEGKGFSIDRYNLSSEPSAFVTNTKVNQLLNEKGPDILPIILLDNEVIMTGSYPENKALAEWFDINPDELVAKPSSKSLL